MLRLNGFRAWISVDHKPLDIYKMEIDDERNIATCWVPSTAGKPFAVSWQDLSPVRTVATSGRVTVDGIRCGGKVIPPSGEASSSKARRDSIRTGPTAVRPFTFGTLDLTDDDKYLDCTSHSLGEIKLSVHRVAIEGHVKSHGHRVPTEAESVVHERSKKATSHRVKLGQEIKTPRHNQTLVKDIDRHPLVTFIFKYSSLDLLKAKGIAPKHSVSKHSRREHKRPRDDVVTSDDEVELLVLERAHPRLRSRKHRKIKPEGTVKSEIPDVIDLT